VQGGSCHRAAPPCSPSPRSRPVRSIAARELLDRPLAATKQPVPGKGSPFAPRGGAPRSPCHPPRGTTEKADDAPPLAKGGSSDQDGRGEKSEIRWLTEFATMPSSCRRFACRLSLDVNAKSLARSRGPAGRLAPSAWARPRVTRLFLEPVGRSGRVTQRAGTSPARSGRGPTGGWGARCDE